MMAIMLKAKRKIYSNNLVFMGGCAMNATANRTLHYQFNRVWSLPWPGDASSSIGAVLAHTKLQTEYKSNEIVKHLKLVYN
jgi:predicted NodU family carbamoyl transferase